MRFLAVALLFWLAPLEALAQNASPHPASPPLKPGRSAGLKAAQQARVGLALIGGGAILAVVAVAASAGGNGHNNSSNSQMVPTTTTP